MPRTRPPYPPEFREEAVRLLRSSGLPLPEVARELGVSPQSLRNWLGQAQIDAGERDGLSGDEREECVGCVAKTRGSVKNARS